MDEFTAVVRARQFIRQAGVNAIPVEMDSYLHAAKAIYKVRHDLPDDVSGNTTLIAGRHCIFVNGGHTLERQRFTILHEIAHIVLGLPSVHNSLIKTAVLMSYARRPPEEVCCDAFAAECLLPHDFFKRAVDRQTIGFSGVGQLAEDYRASLTCTGSRYALVNEAPCAFVLAESGIVRYVSSSQGMRERGGWIRIGMSLPQGSAAQQIRSGHILDGPIEVNADVWMDDARRGGPYILEEAWLLPEWDQVLSLLWFEEDSGSGDDVFDDMDDDGGLEELDGILPWPSKKRRR
jgi:hypothetical protein